MKFTIDKKQAAVAVDGVIRTDVSLASLPVGVAAVRWFGEYGTVDYTLPDTPNTLRRRRIAEFSEYQAVLDLFAVPVTVTEQPLEPLPKQFTSLEYLDLFTPDEQLAVVSATMTNAQVKLWYDKMLAAGYITIADPRTEAGLNALVSASLLTADRKSAIVEAMS